MNLRGQPHSGILHHSSVSMNSIRPSLYHISAHFCRAFTDVRICCSPGGGLVSARSIIIDIVCQSLEDVCMRVQKLPLTLSCLRLQTSAGAAGFQEGPST